MRGKYLTGSVCLALLCGCTTPKDPGPDFVESKWTDAVSRLGGFLKPVYPPTEEISVGDVFAVVDGDPGKSVKQIRLGYAKEAVGKLKDIYKDRLKLPKMTSAYVSGAAQPQGKEPQVGAAQPQSNEPTGGAPQPQGKPLFDDRFTDTLPITAFPNFTLAKGSYFDFAASLPGKVAGLLFGYSAAESTDVLVSVQDSNTIGLPVYDALEALDKFCSGPQKPCDREQMALAYHAVYGTEPTGTLVPVMISRVYLTSNITYNYILKSSAATRAVAGQLDTLKALSDTASKIVEPVQTASNASGGTVTDTSLAARDALLQKLLDGINDNLKALSSNSGQPAIAFSGLRYSGGSIALVQNYVRPLTFAYGSVRWKGEICKPSCGSVKNPMVVGLPTE